MSMNLHLKIDGIDVLLPHTKTKETSFVLGVDVEQCNDGKGFSTGYELSSLNDSEKFKAAYERLKELALAKSIEQGDIDNLFAESIVRIKDSLHHFSYKNDVPTRSEAILYFL